MAFDKPGRAWHTPPFRVGRPPPAPPRGVCKEVVGMVKAAWGTKRSCQNCGARFYDLNKNPITCPKCGQAHDPEDFVKARRSRALPAAAKVPSAAPAKKPKALIDGVPIADDDLPAVDDAADEAAALEDTDDLAEDDAEIEVEIEDKNPDEET